MWREVRHVTSEHLLLHVTVCCYIFEFENWKSEIFFCISIKFGNLRFHNSFDSMHSHCLNTALVLRFNLAFPLEWGRGRPPLKDVCPHKIFGKTIDTIGYCFGQFSPLKTFSSGKFSATSRWGLPGNTIVQSFICVNKREKETSMLTAMWSFDLLYYLFHSRKSKKLVAILYWMWKCPFILILQQSL